MFIHALESGNCTSRGIGTDVTCQMVTKRFDPMGGSGLHRVFISGNESHHVKYISHHALYFITTDEDPRLGRNVW